MSGGDSRWTSNTGSDNGVSQARSSDWRSCHFSDCFGDLLNTLANRADLLLLSLCQPALLALHPFPMRSRVASLWSFVNGMPLLVIT